VKTSAFNAEHAPPAFPMFLPSLAHLSAPRWWQGIGAAAAVILSSWRCAAAALLSTNGPRLSSHPAQALISSRTGSRTALSAVHFTNPQAGSMCRNCFLMQEAPATKTSLQYLCWCMRLVFLLNDLGMNSILSLLFKYTNIHVHLYVCLYMYV